MKAPSMTQVHLIASRIIWSLLGCLLLVGCAFSDLKKDLAQFEAATAISGRIDTGGPSNEPVFIALYRQLEAGRYELETSSIQYGPGEFRFLRGQGDYYLIAFEDVNKDFIRQPDERIGWYRAPSAIEARPGNDVTDLNVVLESSELTQGDLPKLLASSMLAAPKKLGSARLGEVVDLNDPDFAPGIGALGLWQPVTFVQEKYHGIFFLEPYSPDKTRCCLSMEWAAQRATGGTSSLNWIAAAFSRGSFNIHPGFRWA